MFQIEWLMLMLAGGVFVLLGLGALFWGRGEENDYYQSISHRVDVREYVEHRPERPEPSSLKIGGWIAIAIGVIMVVAGGGVWLWG